MDINTVNSLAMQTSAGQTGDAVNIQVLKKAMDIQAQMAAQLIASVPPVASNPPHLGQNIDMTV
ncbi:MAG: YjfB family protein [Azovibrio sp.]|uniref:YjfB family protein n=1 Tax=Azovibrio sp. TaxID=1872673 RepID=UPI003C728A67